MASTDKTDQPNANDAAWNPAEDDANWTTVSEPESDDTKFVFSFIGQRFIGVFLGTREVTNADGSFTQGRFRADDETIYFINLNYSLEKSLRPVRPGKIVRITYVSDKDTGQASPLRIYQVDVKR